MKVKIDRVCGGWRYFTMSESMDADGHVKQDIKMQSLLYPSYPAAKRAALTAGHEVDNADWMHRLLMWQCSSDTRSSAMIRISSSSIQSLIAV